jgi:hypothetical protein
MATAKDKGARSELPGDDAPPKKVDDDRVVQSIGFETAQWDAIEKAAYTEGDKPGPWIRRQALRTAREMGFWRPFEQPGPRKKGATE